MNLAMDFWAVRHFGDGGKRSSAEGGKITFNNVCARRFSVEVAEAGRRESSALISRIAILELRSREFAPDVLYQVLRRRYGGCGCEAIDDNRMMSLQKHVDIWVFSQSLRSYLNEENELVDFLYYSKSSLHP